MEDIKDHMKIWDRSIEHSIRYSKLRDIIRSNNFFILDIKNTDEHLTRTGNLTRTSKGFLFSLHYCLFRVTRTLFIDYKA